MFDEIQLNPIMTAIERLAPDARYTLKEWFFSQDWPEELEEYRVAETAAKYQTRYLSFEEYLEEEAAGGTRYEYLDGVMYAMSGSRLRHNVICTNVLRAVANHLGNGPCRVFSENTKVSHRSRAKNFCYYPDLLVACGKYDLDDVHLSDPKLVIEVLSPSTERLDRNEKAVNYRHIASLEEYVLIAQNRCEVTIQRRKDDWQSLTLGLLDETLQLESIELSLPLAKIYERA
jgi:Uma2 family endonuclease